MEAMIRVTKLGGAALCTIKRVEGEDHTCVVEDVIEEHVIPMSTISVDVLLNNHHSIGLF